jgi:hypothetical protein
MSFYVANSPSNDVGYYIVIGDMVTAVMYISTTSDAVAYTRQVRIPSPKYGAIGGILDYTGQYKFMVNQNGVFQNASTIPTGGCWVSVTYISK